MSSPQLQFEPMSTGQLLDRAFRFYGQNFSLMVGIAAIAYVPQFLVQLLADLPGPSSAVVAVAVVLGAVAILIGFLIVTPLVTGATTKALSERYLGREVTIGAALRTAWSKLGALLLTQFIVGIVVFVGLILLIVPGVLWMCSYALVAPVAVLETTNLSEIRYRSWELVSGYRGKVFGILLVIVVLELLLGGAGGLLSLGFEDGSRAAAVFDAGFTSLIGVLLLPLQTIAVTLLYYDLRIRKEGFDLDMLSQAVSGQSILK